MDAHLLCLRTSPERAHDLCPEGTHGAQLGDLQEEVRAHREGKGDL
jgi:hypothetical protein